MDRFLSEAERLIGAVADAARREGVIETLERVVEHLESKPGVYCFDAAQEFRAEIERLKGV